MALALAKTIDPKDELLDKVGDVSGVEIFNTGVLVAKYIRSNVTRGGIVVPETVRQEDVYQGKIGLVVAVGHSAFKETDGKWFGGKEIGVGDWVLYRASDGLDMKINGSHGTDCKLLQDTSIRGRIDRPDRIW